MPIETLAAGKGGEGMRLLQRSLVRAFVAKRRVADDDLGGMTEGFCQERHELMASLSYVANTLSASGNNLNSEMFGVRRSQSVRLRTAPDTLIEVGDGVMLPGDEGIAWRCVQVDMYPYVKVARLDRITGVD